SGGKVVLWILLSLVVLLGVFAAYLYFSGKLGAFLEGVKKQDAASTLAALEGEKPPPPSEYELAASRLVEQIRKSISGGDSALAGQCRTFLLSGKVPGNDKEKQLETTIVEYFASADEEQIENARLKKIREYEAEIIRKEAAAAEAARLRQIEELRRRDARIKQQEQEALRREAENKRKAAQRIVTNFKNRMTAYEQRIYRELNPYSEKNDIAGYKKLLESNLAEAGKAPPEFKVHTRTMVNKTREMERMLTPAWDWQKLLVDGDAAVEGLDITIRFDLCKVTAIRAGVLYAQTVSGKEIRVPVEKILRTKAFVKFLVNLGYKNKKLGSLPFFFFWRNEPVIAKMIAGECSAREQALYRNFVLNYLRNALQGRHRGKLIRKFGPTDEYKALMPRPKVVPRKAPPKKAPVKKAPVKKTAPKKK
ncbi:MAG: hypothetical protein J6S58_00885, partial [Lentisphaeria bacterium]|nr:hypothetical protein [Lentisphaeria bacterium]